MRFFFLLSFNESTPDRLGRDFQCIAPDYDSALEAALKECDRLWGSNPKYDPARAVATQLEIEDKTKE